MNIHILKILSLADIPSSQTKQYGYSKQSTDNYKPVLIALISLNTVDLKKDNTQIRASSTTTRLYKSTCVYI